MRDQGPGIAPIQQEFVFERFARGVNGESAPPGWGLGLYLSRRLINAQGGVLGVRSPVSEDTNRPGSEFFILLPIDETPEDG